MVDPT